MLDGELESFGEAHDGVIGLRSAVISEVRGFLSFFGVR